MTLDSPIYFGRAIEDASFDTARMSERDVVSTDGLVCHVNALEPGQRYEPSVDHGADKLHIVLLGRGAFVVDKSRQIMGPGDVALVPAGTDHRAFANQDERLVMLVVTSPCPSPSVVPPENVTVPPPVRMPPVIEAPQELPVARMPAPQVRTQGTTGPAAMRSTSELSRYLNSLRAQRSSPAAEVPSEIPETKRRAPLTSRVRSVVVEASDPSTGAPAPSGSDRPAKSSDFLPEIFQRPAEKATAPAPVVTAPAVVAPPEPPREIPPPPPAMSVPAPRPKAEPVRAEKSESSAASGALPDIFGKLAKCEAPEAARTEPCLAR